MAYETFRDRKLVLAFAPAFPVQADFDAAFSSAIITKRHPQTNPQFPSLLTTKDETKDCSGEFLRIKKVTSRVSQFTFTYDATAKTGAGWFGYGFGVAAAPTGTPQNEQQVIKTTNTAGSPTFALDFEGLSAISAGIPFNSTAAQTKAILERIRPIKTGNILVTGTALNHVSGLTVEFINKLAKANIPLLTFAENGATGGTTTVTAGQNGANKTHLFSMQTGEKPVKFSIISGFEGATGGTKLYKNLIVGSVTVSAVKRGKVTITVVAFGSAVPEILSGYTMPACENIDPIMVADCRAKIAGNWITDDLQSFSVAYSNGFDPNDPENFPFDDIDIAELERGDRSVIYNLQLLGNDTSPLYQAMDVTLAPDGYKAPVEIYVGQPGERFFFVSSNVQLELDDQPISFVGNKNKSAFNITGTATPDDSTGIVAALTYHGANATQYLLDA